MSHDHHNHGSGDGDCVFYHALTFHAGVCQEILFPGWTSTNAVTVFGSAVALFVAGFLYEGLKYGREVLARSGAVSASQINIAKSEGGAPPTRTAGKTQFTMWSSGHLIQTLTYMIQTTVSYVLMLVFMTYNVWLCMGLVLGMGLGYLVFGWRRSQVEEHCCN